MTLGWVPACVPGVILRRGTARLQLATDPGPTVYQPVTDGRTLSVTVREPRLGRG